jgi:hypothetical protein
MERGPYGWSDRRGVFFCNWIYPQESPGPRRARIAYGSEQISRFDGETEVNYGPQRSRQYSGGTNCSGAQLVHI